VYGAFLFSSSWVETQVSSSFGLALGSVLFLPSRTFGSLCGEIFRPLAFGFPFFFFHTLAYLKLFTARAFLILEFPLSQWRYFFDPSPLLPLSLFRSLGFLILPSPRDY